MLDIARMSSVALLQSLTTEERKDSRVRVDGNHERTVKLEVKEEMDSEVALVVQRSITA